MNNFPSPYLKSSKKKLPVDMLFAPKHPAFKEKDVSHGTLKNQFICSKILVLVIFVQALIRVPWDPFVER